MKVASHDPLKRALCSLEPENASPGFTARVMSELETRRSFPDRRARGLAFAGSLAALVVGIVAVWNLRSPDTAELVREAQALRLEQQTLEQELESLRLRAAETAPVLYLGGDDEFDLVLDLAPLVSSPMARMIPAATGERENLDL